jgi:hypothetical protein
MERGVTDQSQPSVRLRRGTGCERVWRTALIGGRPQSDLCCWTVSPDEAIACEQMEEHDDESPC